MQALTTDLLGRACRTFLKHAYPAGESSMPRARRPFFAIPPDRPLSELLAIREVCEKLLTPEGRMRGYAFRLGSACFPHLKLQVVGHDNDASCVFCVDTHDTLRCKVTGAEAEAWAQLQADNRRLKETIEHEWEKEGLLTFNGLLRRGLAKK